VLVLVPPVAADPVGPLEVGQHEDVEQLGLLESELQPPRGRVRIRLRDQPAVLKILLKIKPGMGEG
jgi:hypothetical protein